MAEITPTAVQLFDMPTNIISGATERRLKGMYLEGPKAAQNDYFLLTDFLSAADSANILSWHGVVKDVAVSTLNAMAIDVFTYDDDDGKLDCTSAGTGTSSVFVYYHTH